MERKKKEKIFMRGPENTRREKSFVIHSKLLSIVQLACRALIRTDMLHSDGAGR